MNKPFKIKKVDFDYLDNNKELWTDLIKSSKQNYIFNDLSFLKSYFQTFNVDNDLIIFLAISNVDKKWLAAFPVVKHKSDILDFKTNYIYSSCYPFADYFSPIINQGKEDFVYPDLIENIINSSEKFDIIKLSNIVNENEFLGFLEKFLIKNNYFFKKEKLGCPFISLKNKSEDEVFRTFKKNHRTDIKRQINKLNKMGALSLRLLSSNDNKKIHMRSFFKMYEKRWTSIGHLNPMEKNRKKLFFKNIFYNVDISNLHFSGLFFG